MAYSIIELQTDAEGSTAVVTPIQTKATKEEAESVWHGILSVAATSKVPIHTAVVLNPEGKLIATQCYKHEGGEG